MTRDIVYQFTKPGRRPWTSPFLVFFAAMLFHQDVSWVILAGPWLLKPNPRSPNRGVRGLVGHLISMNSVRSYSISLEFDQLSSDATPDVDGVSKDSSSQVPVMKRRLKSNDVVAIKRSLDWSSG